MENSLLLVVIAVCALALFFGVRAFLGYRQVARDARADYAYKTREDLFEAPMPEQPYLRAYRRYHAPRGTAYVAGAMIAVLVLSVPAFVLIQFLLEQLWISTGRSEVFHPGYLVWQFMIFFAVIATWGGIIYVTAREYHRRAPLSFKRVLDEELGQ